MKWKRFKESLKDVNWMIAFIIWFCDVLRAVSRVECFICFRKEMLDKYNIKLNLLNNLWSVNLYYARILTFLFKSLVNSYYII